MPAAAVAWEVALPPGTGPGVVTLAWLREAGLAGNKGSGGP